MNNHGVKLEELPVGAMPFGSVGESQPDLVSDGNGEPYLPTYEPQNVGTETYACTVFSLFSHIEAQRKLHGLDERNFSDRFAAFYANIENGVGTTFTNAYEAVLQNWACLEPSWPMPKPPFTFTDYYSEPSDEAKEQAQKQKSGYGLGMRVYVAPNADDFRAALRKLGSLWCWNGTHAFIVYRVDDRIRIFDTYPYNNGGIGKRDLPLSAFGTEQGVLGGYYVPLLIKPQNMQFKEKTLYQLAEGIGGFLHFRNGVLVRDTEAKLIAEFISVNGGDIAGKTGMLTMKDIEGVQLYNTKGEKVTLGNPV